jgi:NADH-quinone oxidoreductase subunit E
MSTAATLQADDWRTRLAERFESRPESLIPALQYLQECAGYLPPEGMTAVADHLKVSRSKVFGVASFYSLFHLQPRGRHQVTVCRGTACHVRGSARLLSDLEHMLGVKAGGTTPDLLFSLGTVACVGSCALAPVVVKDKVYGRQTSASVKGLIENLRKAPAGAASGGRSRAGGRSPRGRSGKKR